MYISYMYHNLGFRGMTKAISWLWFMGNSWVFITDFQETCSFDGIGHAETGMGFPVGGSRLR